MNEIFYKTKDYLMFSYFDRIELEDVTVSDLSESKFFKKFPKAKFDIKHCCYVLPNANFEELSITSYDQFYYLNPYGCSLLKLIIDQDYIGAKYNTICSFFRRVSIFTKVDLTIEMPDKIFTNFIKLLDTVFESDVIKLTLNSNGLKDCSNKAKLLKKILGLNKLRVFQENDNGVKCVDLFDRKLNKLEFHLRKLLDFHSELTIEEDFLDHVDIF